MADNLTMIIELLTTIAEKLDRITAGGSPTVCKYTFNEWLKEWYEVYKAPKLKDKGYDLGNTIRRHVLPNISDKPLNEYTALDITKALNAVGSERMRQIVRQIYSQCFREAVALGYIDKNPVELVHLVAHKYKNGRTLERSEEAAFLDAAKSEPELYPVFAFYLLTGARPSEPFGIKWEDVTSEYIRIRGTKTAKSDRILPMSESLQALLGKIPHDSEYVFPYTYAKIRYAMKRIKRQLSFNLTVKDLRHTFGTRCIESGVSMKTVQKWLGHSRYETTANIYSHITTDFEREELAKFSAKHGRKITD